MLELGFAYLVVFQHQQLGRITLRQGIFRNPFVGQGIIEILYMYFGYHREILVFDAKLHIIRQIWKTRGLQFRANECRFEN